MVGLTQSAWCSSSLYIGIMDSQNSHGSMMLVSSVLPLLLLLVVTAAVLVTWPLATTTEELADLVSRELTMLPEPPEELEDLWMAEMSATAAVVVESLLPELTEVVPPPVLLPYLLLE